jgi:hypothetical protein
VLRAEYIAGFFDGEGSVGVYRNGRGTYHLRTQLTQNVSPLVTELLMGLREEFGGNLSKQRTTHGVKYNWQLNSGKAVTFLATIEPMLLLKKEQANVAIAWWQTVARRQADGPVVCSTLKALKKVRGL